jgi:hypothetical protein
MTLDITRVWDGEQVSQVVALAFGPGDRASVSSPVLGACAGQETFAILAHQFGDFLRTHAACCLVCHDAGRFHWAMDHHFEVLQDAEARKLLWEFSRTSRLWDIALLAQLAGLAEHGAAHPKRESVPELARRWCVGLSPASGSAASAAYAVWGIFVGLIQHVERSAPQTAQACFGPLGLGIQVMGAIALGQAEANGLHLIAEAREELLQKCRQSQQECIASLVADRPARQWLKRTDGNQIKFQWNGMPDVREKQLRQWLSEILESVRGFHQTALDQPLDGKDRLSTDPTDWGILARGNGRLRAWADLMTASRLLSSPESGGRSVVQPRYEVLPRIRSLSPDLGQVRRSHAPAIFQPSGGNTFLIVELPNLELWSLAVFCEERFGSSKLGQILRMGHDPALATAAALAGLDAHGFVKLATEDPDKLHRLRVIASALLIAAPRGLGAEIARDFARLEFEQDISLAEMQEYHDRLVSEIYPELAAFLSDDTLDVMAENLQTFRFDLDGKLENALGEIPSPEELRRRFLHSMDISGLDTRLWQILNNFQNIPSLCPFLKQPGFNFRLYELLFSRNVTTLSGRVRGRMLYSGIRSAAYLDLADDAVKCAAYGLAAAGFKLMAVAEMNIVLEVPLTAELGRLQEQAERAVTTGLENVLGAVTVCPVRIGDRW